MVQLVEPARDIEPELQEVEKSLKRLVEKARQTVLRRKVNIFTLYRIQNLQIGKDSNEPFHVNLSSKTLEQYQQVWIQLLVYIIRAFQTESQLYRLTPTQEVRVRDVLIAANRYQVYESNELNEEELNIMHQEMDKSCLALCIALLDHKLSREYESAVVSYLAVAGLERVSGNDGSQYRFLHFTQYMSTLSGFIKVAQMLTIQYCLQKEEQKEVESCMDMVDQLHAKFLVYGTATPIDWALRLRLYGRELATK
jgi:hypothetical protein